MAILNLNSILTTTQPAIRTRYIQGERDTDTKRELSRYFEASATTSIHDAGAKTPEPEITLHVAGPYVEVSTGIRVSLSAVRRLFHLRSQGKPIIGQPLDGYTVIRSTDFIQIGCHKITRQEVDRLAVSQGWT